MYCWSIGNSFVGRSEEINKNQYTYTPQTRTETVSFLFSYHFLPNSSAKSLIPQNSSMDDVKDKMKGFMKKMTPSSSSKFKGQGRVLGSSSSSPTPANCHNSRLIPATSNTPKSSLPNPKPKPNPNPNPNPSPSSEFDPFDPLISTTATIRSNSVATFDCPICSTAFLSESEVSAHVDSCLAQESGAAESKVAESVSSFVSGEPKEESVEIVMRLMRNVVREPGNEKFRRIRMGNPKIKEAIGDARGGVELLESVGFRVVEEEGEIWAIMEVPTEGTVAGIMEAVSLLERWKEKGSKDSKGDAGENAVAETKPNAVVESKPIDRQVRVFFSVPESVAAKIDLPESFYNLSIDEIRREAQSRKKRMEESQLLIPKSYKEKQANAARKKYKLTVIRIQFPDGVVLQGIFRPLEPTTVLYEFVSSSLKEPSLEFELLSPAASRLRVIPRFPLPGDRRISTLEEERLVPSALIKFKPIETDSIPFTGLNNELLEASEPLTSETTLLKQ